MGLRGPLRSPTSRRGLAEIRRREKAQECASLGIEYEGRTQARIELQRRVRLKGIQAFNAGKIDKEALAEFQRKRREYHFKRKYGMSIADYEAMRELRSGRCDICLQQKTLNVDHCHATGRVRGLLCRECNTALGQFKDSPEALMRAAGYVAGTSGSGNHGTSWSSKKSKQQARQSGDTEAPKTRGAGSKVSGHSGSAWTLFGGPEFDADGTTHV